MDHRSLFRQLTPRVQYVPPIQTILSLPPLSQASRSPTYYYSSSRPARSAERPSSPTDVIRIPHYFPFRDVGPDDTPEALQFSPGTPTFPPADVQLAEPTGSRCHRGARCGWWPLRRCVEGQSRWTGCRCQGVQVLHPLRPRLGPSGEFQTAMFLTWMQLIPRRDFGGKRMPTAAFLIGTSCHSWGHTVPSTTHSPWCLSLWNVATWLSISGPSPTPINCNWYRLPF